MSSVWKKQVARAEEQVREAKEVHAHMEEKLASGLRDLEALRAEASEHPRHCPEPSTPGQAMDVDPMQELIRLRAQVAELQCESGSRVPRTSVPTALVPLQGDGVDNPSAVMSNLIEAADSALRDAVMADFGQNRLRLVFVCVCVCLCVFVCVSVC